MRFTYPSMWTEHRRRRLIVALTVVSGICATIALYIHSDSSALHQHGVSYEDKLRLPALQRLTVTLNTPLLAENSKPRTHPKFLIEPWPVNASQTSYLPYSSADHLWSSITIVKSGVRNAGRRNAIRQTWGAIKFMDGVRFETVFIVGKTNDAEAQEALRKENEIYGDLLQTDIQDNRKNLPLKIEAGMHWASLNFEDYWLYSSADDDMVLHPPNFARYVNALIRDKGDPTSSAMKGVQMICVYGFVTNGKPARSQSSKWYMSEDLYPNPNWPPYCRGGWYSMPIGTVARIYEVSRRTPILYLDDVWLTGLIRLKMYNEGSDKFDVGTLLSEQGIVGAPLADRTGTQFYYRSFEDDLNKVIVSHTWGNYGLFPTDVATQIRNTWETWKASVRSRMKNVVF